MIETDPATGNAVVVYRYMVEYQDGAGNVERDVFATLGEAKHRQAYLTLRGRASTLWQV